MIDLSIRNLRYLSEVARTGSVTEAARVLGVTQPTVSEQIKRLEAALGEELLRRSGRTVTLTEAGEVAVAHAHTLFGSARELVEAVRHHRAGFAGRLAVGVSDLVPKLVARAVLAPLLDLNPPVHLVVRQSTARDVLRMLEVGEVDVLLTEGPTRTVSSVRTHGSVAIESGLDCFAATSHAALYREGFPTSLDGAPVLLPSAGTSLRAQLEQWFEDRDLMPFVVAEFDDSAQMKAFGQAAAGAFFAPAAISADVCGDYDVEVVGSVPEIEETFYVTWSDRVATHPALLTLTGALAQRS